jgi:hypothetical protein
MLEYALDSINIRYLESIYSVFFFFGHQQKDFLDDLLRLNEEDFIPMLEKNLDDSRVRKSPNKCWFPDEEITPKFLVIMEGLEEYFLERPKFTSKEIRNVLKSALSKFRCDNLAKLFELKHVKSSIESFTKKDFLEIVTESSKVGEGFDLRLKQFQKQKFLQNIPLDDIKAIVDNVTKGRENDNESNAILSIFKQELKNRHKEAFENFEQTGEIKFSIEKDRKLIIEYNQDLRKKMREFNEVASRGSEIEPDKTKHNQNKSSGLGI